jgi:hypothetical protein
MSAQMNLLAPSEEKRIEVPVCGSVLYAGASSCNSQHKPLFPHCHVPAMPTEIEAESDWLAALNFAEGDCRYDQAPCARFKPTKPSRTGSGSCGPGAPRLMSLARGIEVNDRLVSWSVVLAARTEQREMEPEVARARDLAQAYHYLDYYGHVYGEPEDGDSWSPVPLIQQIAAEARQLGGEPELLEPRTEYMRTGLTTLAS